jgi:Zn-dependent M16 (insulinase) family peptidase
MHKNFTITKSIPIEEIHATLVEIEHNLTHAKIVHIQNDDPENFFCISFPTYPQNSQGSAHILEHTVLCGSKKYPVKDPFFSMIRRSLATFMNAFTGADFTCYPASSCIEKDFYNLLDVYLDAVFHPELKEISFLQEGHHLEFSKENQLFCKGVVYNEMKGSMNSPEDRLWHTLMQRLVPDLPYRFNSGGDPKEIPSLTYENLKKFHSTFYHPSKALFFFYGSLPLDKHLQFLEEKLLKDYSHAIEPIKKIPLQKRFTKPQKYTDYYPYFAKENLHSQNMIALSFLTTPITDQKTLLALTLLDTIFMDHDASLLLKELLSSGLMEDAYSILDSEMSEIPYTIVCKGCLEENAPKIEELILKTFEKYIKTPLDPKLIEAAKHQIEFDKLEITGGKTPYGLTLFFRAALAYQHGCQMEDSLKIHSLFHELEKDLSNPEYIPQLIQKYLVKNNHRVLAILKPDATLQEKEDKEEKKWLSSLQKKLTEPEKKQIIQQTKDILDYQKKLENQSLECLPEIALKDIFSQAINYSLNQENNLFSHFTFTNNILYAEYVYNIDQLPLNNLFELSLFSSVVSQLGAGGKNYLQTLADQQAYTGGISSQVSLNITKSDEKRFFPTFSLIGKCLYRNTDKLFTLFNEIRDQIDFTDQKRMQDLIQQQYLSYEQAIQTSSLSYATLYAFSHLHPVSYIQNAFSGVSYFTQLKKIYQDIDNLSPLFTSLKKNHSTLLSHPNADLVVTCDEKFYQKFHKKHFLKAKPSSPFSFENFSYQKASLPKRQAFLIPSPVAFNCFALSTITYDHEKSPYISLATALFEMLVLHKEIREQKGAYGSGCKYNPLTGNLYFYSFRDPYIASTFDSFQKSVYAVAQNQFADSDIKQAKLSILQSIDHPIAPGSRASVAYSWKIENMTYEKRNQFREKIISATKEQISKATQEFLVPKLNEYVFITFAGEDLIKRENQILENKKLAFDSLESIV